MRELDQLLLGYLESRYPGASAAQKSAFCELLKLSDPELMAYLLQRQPVPDVLKDVIAQILERTSP
ncbi:MAG: succinate dehydrogenase assembly factor 2 [Gammaproteobacteria bacterium]|nr:succinate dehydrogenase assembly factor 2 [Gammaproteobacteria bacterium]